MRIIGITGGVGAGKSEILKIIEDNCKCFILIADEAAHEVEKKGNSAYEDLVKLLGAQILDADGEIDKRKMAEKIFSDSGLLLKVNSIIHPRVKEYILQLIEQKRIENSIDFFFVEAALLIEDGYEAICDELWYVYTDVEKRRERLKITRGYSDEKIDAIMRNQNDEATFRKHCSFVIDNNDSLDYSREQIISRLIGYRS